MNKKKSNPTYIAVEGPIGVGKTALAEKIAQRLGARMILEPVDDNPFLERFYLDPAKYGFQTQLYFLLERYQQQQDLCQQELFSGITVSDYLFAKDRIFAYLNLDEAELKLYEQIFNLLDRRLTTPDLVIYLQAGPDVLQERIKKRKRNFERGIREAYLEALNRAYNKFFFHYKESPLLVINTSQVDFVASEEDFNQVMEKIRTTKSGVQHFIPLGSGKTDRDGTYR